MHAVPLLSLLVLTVVSGCTSPPEDVAAPAAEPQAWELANDVSDCVEHVAVLLVDPAAAQAALPGGFSAADASEVLDLPAPTGQAAVFVNAVHCGDRSSAELAIPIEHPQTDLPAVRYSFYQLGYTSTNATLVALLQDVGFPAFGGHATGSFAPEGLLGDGTAAVAGSHEMRYAFDYVAGGPEPMDITARFWHVSQAGTIHVEFTIDASTSYKGTTTDCTIGPGSLLHALVGSTDCTGQEVAVLAFPSQSWEGVIRFTPA